MMTPEQLTAAIDEYCREHHTFGSLRITQNDEILYKHTMGYANLETKKAFDDESMFTLYSLSKPFCAMGLLRLMERGLVDLECHPSRYLPEAEGFDERVTLRQMLQHVSGLPDFYLCGEFDEPYPLHDPDEMRRQVKRLTSVPSLFAPGTQAQYANINYYLPALIIENVTDTPYEDYMRAEVFDPLEMPHAIVERRPIEIPNRVQGYALVDGLPVPTEKSFEWMLGAGDVVATVDDVYCLHHAVRDRLLLKDDTWDQVLTPSPLNAMGLGCTIKAWHNKLRITHNGGHTGFRTYHIHILQDDLDIILLSNSGYGQARNDLAEILYDFCYHDGSEAGEQNEMDKGYI